MVDDVTAAKAELIERCLARIDEVYGGIEANLRDDITKQESILLNLQRACEAAIDLAMHVVRSRKLGIPEQSRDAFDLLARAHLVETDLADAMKRMVGLRNIAVHHYTRLDLGIVRRVLDEHLHELRAFSRAMLSLGT